MGILTEVTAPGSLPVTLGEARQQCRLYDDTTHDALLLRLIKAATKEVEAYTGATLVTRTLQLNMDGFESYEVDLQVYPVASVTSIKYDDVNNSEQEIASDDFYAQTDGREPYVRPVSSWPTPYSGKVNSVRVLFVAGYASVAAIPEDIRLSILMRVSEMYENLPATPFSQTPAQTHRRYG